MYLLGAIMNWGKKINPNTDLCYTDMRIWKNAINLCSVSEKEVRESFNFVEVIKKKIQSGNIVLELCCGHGLIGQILIQKHLVKSVIQICNIETKSHQLLELINNSFSDIYFYNWDIYEKENEILKFDYDAVIACHACGGLTDKVIDFAIKKDKNIFVCPCCYHYNLPKELVKIYSQFGSNGVNIYRISKLMLSGYNTSVRELKSNITPLNKVIIGVKQ